MTTPMDELLKIYKHVTSIANQTTELAKNVNDLEAKITAQQALIDIGLGFIVKQTGKDEFIKHLKCITESEGFSKEAKLAASEMLRQENLWSGEQIMQ